jgi:quercetin dioxygenase-like cupin family protein
MVAVLTPKHEVEETPDDFELPEPRFTIRPASLFWSPRYRKEPAPHYKRPPDGDLVQELDQIMGHATVKTGMTPPSRTKKPKAEIPHVEFEVSENIQVKDVTLVKKGEKAELRSSTQSREFIVDAGNGILICNGKQWSVAKGSDIFIPTGDVQVIQAGPDEDLVLNEMGPAEK